MTEEKRVVKFISRTEVAERRRQVLEFQLAGHLPHQIAQELARIPVFVNTTRKTVANDIAWLRKQGELEQVVTEVEVKAVYQKCRGTHSTVLREANWRFKHLSDRLHEVEGRARSKRELVEGLGQEDAQRETEQAKLDELESRAEQLHGRLQTETKLLLHIADEQAELLKKLGYVPERKEVGVYGTSEMIQKAIGKVKDAGKQEEAIRALELIEGFLS